MIYIRTKKIDVEQEQNKRRQYIKADGSTKELHDEAKRTALHDIAVTESKPIPTNVIMLNAETFIKRYINTEDDGII